MALIKMLLNKDKYHYKRNFQLSLIISLCAFIIFFYFFPSINFKDEKEILINEPLIFLHDVPQTVQRMKQKEIFGTITNAPKIPLPSDIEISILKDINLTIENIRSTSDGNSDIEQNKSQSNVSFVPRQIFEVIPEKNDDVSGVIKLSLKINTDGKVTAHKILSNTTKSTQCLSNVISAAYKSKWEPLKFESGVKEYWVEKSYSFN